MLFVRRISWEAASKRLRSKRTAGLVVMPLRFNDFLTEKAGDEKILPVRSGIYWENGVREEKKSERGRFQLPHGL